MSSTITGRKQIRIFYERSIRKHGRIICFALLLLSVQLQAQTTVSNGLDFDGQDDYVQLPPAAYFRQNQFTVEAWVYPRAFNSWSRVIDFSNGPSSDNVLMAVTDGPTGLPAGSIFRGGDGHNFTATTTLELNTWTHLAITVDGSTAKIYINGELNMTDPDVLQVNNIERTLNYIGKSPWADGYADMILDELKIWNSVLTENAIADNRYKKPVAGQGGLIAYFDFNQGVPQGDNTSITQLIDKSGNDYHGTFHNFNLTGSGSNFVEGVQLSADADYTSYDLVPVIYAADITRSIFSAPFTVHATSLSPAPFTYSLQSGTSITLNGATITATGPGTSVIRISQAATAGFAETYTDVTVTIKTLPADFSLRQYEQPGGFSPTAIAHGDVNGDGFEDLAVTFMETHTVTIYRNDGTGVFRDPVSYELSSVSFSIAMADLDGDGKLDVAVTNANSATVAVLINKGTGVFYSPVTYPVGSSPRFIAAGDINGDGKPDLAATNYGDNSVSVLINSGAGTFSAPANYQVGTGPAGIAMADLDGDNHPDLAAVSYNSNTISVLMNTGTGDFAPHVTYATGSRPISIAAGDLDGDGRPDLAAANMTGNSVSVFINTGTGTFNAQVAYPIVGNHNNTNTQPIGIAIGDLNGDGKPDLATVNNSNASVSLLFNMGSGTFDPQTVSYRIGSGSWGVTLGDWNGDTLLDVAATNNSSHTLSILLNTGSGILGAANNVITGARYNSLAAGDLNGDHLDDLAIATKSKALLVQINRGDSTYTDPVAYPVGASPQSSAIGDLNGDGKPDVAVANADDNTVSVLFNTGTGTLSAQVTYEVGYYPYQIAMADLNGDGKLDLATTNNGDNTISVLINTGTGTFDIYVPYEVGNNPWGIAAGDLDGDGHLDLAVVNSSDYTISVLINTGTGTFQAQQLYQVGSYPSSIAIGDLDNDGHLDLAITNYYDSNVSVLTNSGTGTFTAAGSYSTGDYPRSVVIADMNGDSKADIVVANEGNDYVSVLNNTGDGFETQNKYNLVGEVNALNVVIADLDHDGRPDVAGAEYSQAFTFYNTTTRTINQTISFDPLSDKTYGSPSFDLAAIPSSGGAVTYSSSNTAVATIAGSKVTMVGAGTATITAAQSGYGFYKPATVENSLTVRKAALTASADNQSRVYGVANPAWTISYSGFVNDDNAGHITAPTAATQATTTSDVGTYPITLSGGAATNYAITLQNGTLTIKKADQTITFAEVPVKTAGDASFALSATATSGLPVTFTSVKAHTTISGASATLVSAGSETITATQPGNTNYNAAVSVSRTFCINPAQPVVTKDFTNPATPVLTSSAAEGNQWYKDGTAITGASQVRFSINGAGQYSVKATVDNCVSVMSGLVTIVVTEIAESENSGISVYPNPAENQIEIRLGEAGVKQIEIISAEGKVVHHSSTSAHSDVVEVSHYPAGVYLMKIVSTQGSKSVRFIKK